MLKIKDSVPLSELEKFGFVEDLECWKCEHSKCENDEQEVRVEKETYVIYISTTWDIAQNSLDIIYSLIKADLVEKVEINDTN
jgi:hypothetical protein